MMVYLNSGPVSGKDRPLFNPSGVSLAFYTLLDLVGLKNIE